MKIDDPRPALSLGRTRAAPRGLQPEQPVPPSRRPRRHGCWSCAPLTAAAVAVIGAGAGAAPAPSWTSPAAFDLGMSRAPPRAPRKRSASRSITKGTSSRRAIRWRRARPGRAPIVGGSAINAVSCSPEGLCVAVDSGGERDRANAGLLELAEQRDRRRAEPDGGVLPRSGPLCGRRRGRPCPHQQPVRQGAVDGLDRRPRTPGAEGCFLRLANAMRCDRRVG